MINEKEIESLSDYSKELQPVIIPEVTIRIESINNSAIGETKNREIKKMEEAEKELAETFKQDIISVISSDFFEDGVTSGSERYVKSVLRESNYKVFKDALMDLYLIHYSDSHVLTGLLKMVGAMDYQLAKPQGPIMALGLLQHENLFIRDRAIRVYEKWNSKEAIPTLQRLRCDAKWLQRYVDKVIYFLERDGK